MLNWKCSDCNAVNCYSGKTICPKCGAEMNIDQKNTLKSYLCLLKKVNSGDSNAEYEIYDLFKSSDVLIENGNEALTMLIQSAKNNNNAAQFELGEMYFWGDSLLEENNPEAFKWFYRSMKNRNVFAKYRVAQCYLNGYGVEKTEEMGFDLILECANEGLANAMEKVADCYYKGIGCSPDNELSFYWLEQATQVENYDISSESAYRLGCHFFEEEMITNKTDSRALHYLNMAYQNGHQMAGCKLAEYFYHFDDPKTKKAAKNIWMQVANSDDNEAKEKAQYFLKDKTF